MIGAASPKQFKEEGERFMGKISNLSIVKKNHALRIINVSERIDHYNNEMIKI